MGVLEIALNFEAEWIVVGGIPRQANSKQEAPPPKVLPSQVEFLLEEQEKVLLLQEQKPQVHSYRENFNFLAMNAHLQHTTEVHQSYHLLLDLNYRTACHPSRFLYRRKRAWLQLDL